MLDKSQDLRNRLKQHTPCIVKDYPPSAISQLFSAVKVRIDEITRGNNTVNSMIAEFESCITSQRETGIS